MGQRSESSPGIKAASGICRSCGHSYTSPPASWIRGAKPSSRRPAMRRCSGPTNANASHPGASRCSAAFGPRHHCRPSPVPRTKRSGGTTHSPGPIASPHARCRGRTDRSHRPARTACSPHPGGRRSPFEKSGGARRLATATPADSPRSSTPLAESPGSSPRRFPAQQKREDSERRELSGIVYLR